MLPVTHDAQLRQAAFSHVNRLSTLRGGVLDSADLAGGFEFGGDRIPLLNPQRGIFKPGKWQGCYPFGPCSPGKVGESGMTISARHIARSTRATNLSTMPSWEPTRTRRITAGS